MSGSSGSRPGTLGKRKAKAPSCPNPLFVQWIGEWRDEAASRNLKTQYTYNEALAALKKYPLRLESGKECKLLEHFGEKTCKMLDEKLADYVREYGTSEPVPGYLNANNNGKRPRGTVDSNFEVMTFGDLQVPLPPTRQRGLDRANFAANQSPIRQRRNTGGRSQREYIPQYRSGAYAIMLTLFQNKHGAMQMSKKDLLQEAQPLAEKSFKIPDPGSRYTAWSSMGTLINKGLVVKESNPAKYRLTITGQAMAARLMDAERDGGFARSEANDDLRFVIGGHEPALPNPPPSDVHKSDNASDDDIAVVTQTDTRSFQDYKNTVQNRTDNDYGSYESGGFQGTSTGAKKKFVFETTAKPVSKTTKSSKLTDCPKPSGSGHLGKPLPKLTGSKIFQNKQNDPRPADDMDLIVINDPSSSSSSQVPSLSEGSQSQDSLKTVPNFSDDTEHSFILKPGTFEIILIVDNSEVFGNASDSMRQVIVKELEKSKVPMHVRPLSVGDFMWIARNKNTAEQDTELVLDYIIERKRMDDLAGSIIDGRFKEQKFRLKHCGIPNPIYLVEEYGSAQNFSIGEDALLQAITNTQITDRFFVKRTSGLKESAAYLTLMTRYVHSLYINKTLCMVAKSRQESLPKNALTESHAHLLSFSEFNKASVKSKTLTVREMFGKQLCQLKGMTSEKAVAILDRYPTISYLIEAYRMCLAANEKENLLASIKFGPNQRNVGAALSKAVFYAYNTKGTEL